MECKVKALTGIAGRGFTYQAGDELSMPSELAEKWVRGGLVEFVDDVPSITTEIDLEVEVAASPAKRARKGRSRKPKNAEKR